MNKRIPVVEDQEDNRRILRDLLTSADYENDGGGEQRGGTGSGGEGAAALGKLARVAQNEIPAG
jgi:hypothetical protein